MSTHDDENDNGGGLADLVAGIIIGVGAAAAAVTFGASVLMARRGRAPAAPRRPSIEVEERASDEHASDGGDVPRVGGGIN